MAIGPLSGVRLNGVAYTPTATNAPAAGFYSAGGSVAGGRATPAQQPVAGDFWNLARPSAAAGIPQMPQTVAQMPRTAGDFWNASMPTRREGVEVDDERESPMRDGRPGTIAERGMARRARRAARQAATPTPGIPATAPATPAPDLPVEPMPMIASAPSYTGTRGYVRPTVRRPPPIV
jgi:hypothetical protein